MDSPVLRHYAVLLIAGHLIVPRDIVTSLLLLLLLDGTLVSHHVAVEIVARYAWRGGGRDELVLGICAAHAGGIASLWLQ